MYNEWTVDLMTSINTARDLEIKTSIQKLIKEWYELKLDKINFPFIYGHTVIPAFNKAFDEEELMMLSEACLDFTLCEGRFVKQFESRLANFFNAECVISTISEQMAFQTTFQLLNSYNFKKTCQPEIITTPFAPHYIMEQGDFTPIIIDIEPDTYNMDTDLLQHAINQRTKAIFIHHTAGNPVNIQKVSEIAKNNNLLLIESCFDSIGSKFKNQHVGTMSDIAVFGFGLNQQFTTGEGGALFLNNENLRKMPVSNIKMTEMQASIGLAQLRKLPYFIEARKRNFNILFDGLRSFQNVLCFPEKIDDSDPCWAYFPVVIKENAAFKKDDLVEYLKNYNILTEPIIEMPETELNWGTKNNTFGYISKNSFKLGIYPSISDEALKFIISKITEFIINNN